MALVGNRRITAKMIQSVQNANSHYDFASNQKNVEKRRNIIMKLSNLQGMVKDCNYTSDYRADRESLIQSFKDQVRRKGTLTKKQFIYANNLYTQFKKRIEKVKKEKK
jgi:S-methylmethionine-dependent homocysteine/selenocysteine methylase